MRRAFAIVVGVVAACGGAQRPADVDNAQAAPPRLKKVASFPPVWIARPDLDVEQLLPDFHEELRWPLSAMSHPELSPQFDIAKVFAQPGIGWIELCERGVQNRITSGKNREELEYLKGWCAAIKGDADKACGRLKPLLTTTVLGMSPAVRVDLVNIIANAGDIDDADRLLQRHRIDDVEILDLLAATYVELGREHDAYEMNRRALDASGRTTPATRCRRLAKDIALGGGGSRAQELDELATKAKIPDPTCVELNYAVKCRLGNAHDCDGYFRNEKIDPENTFLLTAYRLWPKGPSGYARWAEVAYSAAMASRLAGAKELAWNALDAARRTARDCEPRVLRAIWAYHRAWPMQLFADEMKRCKWTPYSR